MDVRGAVSRCGFQGHAADDAEESAQFASAATLWTPPRTIGLVTVDARATAKSRSPLTLRHGRLLSVVAVQFFMLFINNEHR